MIYKKSYTNGAIILRLQALSDIVERKETKEKIKKAIEFLETAEDQYSFTEIGKHFKIKLI